MKKRSTFTNVALGAAAGLVGTIAIQALLKANQKIAPTSIPPVRQDPGEFMVNKAESLMPLQAREKVPDVVESIAAKSLALGYGLTFGALYVAFRPKDTRVLLDGLVLGLVAWATSYLGWLPVLGLMPPVWKQRPAQIIAPIATHLVYGVATASAYDWLEDRVI